MSEDRCSRYHQMAEHILDDFCSIRVFLLIKTSLDQVQCIRVKSVPWSISPMRYASSATRAYPCATIHRA